MKFSKAKLLGFSALVYIFVFATAFSIFVGDDQRNFLVIAFGFLAFPLLAFSRVRIGLDALYAILLIMWMLLVIFFKREPESITSIGYTTIFSAAYLYVVSAVRDSGLKRETVAKLLKFIIYSYAAISVVQLFTSLLGLPILNMILTKGSWSYNSLAVEPSHAGRALAITVMAYLSLNADYSAKVGLYSLIRSNGPVLGAYVASMLLTGSALAYMAIPVSILLALYRRGLAAAVVALLMVFPFFFLSDNESSQRASLFMSALPTMDIAAIAEADHSGAIRVIPFLTYLEKLQIWSMEFWFGGGIDAIAYFVEGELIGAGNLVAAGLIPGYPIAFGMIGLLLFVWTFLGRRLSSATIPMIIFWFLLFSTTAWNSQLPWYGLILVSIVHYFQGRKLSLTLQPNRRYSSLDDQGYGVR